MEKTMSEASFNREDFDRIFGVPKDEIRENYPMIRNAVLEEVALEFDAMRIAFGDTAHSFATYVRDMKT
jgi:hypothetical protein